MNVLGFLEPRPWKCGKVVGLIFFIIASTLVSWIRKNSVYLFLAMFWVGDIGSSSPMGSSNIYGCSPK